MPRSLSPSGACSARLSGWRRWATRNERAALIVLAVADALDGSAPTAAAVRSEFRRARRNARIKDQFDGANYAAIAQRHGLSVRQIRRIVHGH